MICHTSPITLPTGQQSTESSSRLIEPVERTDRMRYKLLKREQAALRTSFPMLTLRPDEKGGGRVTGTLHVMNGIGYTINLVLSKNYPDEVPELFCRREEIDWTADRHVYPDSDGKACLCVELEYRKHWPHGSTITDFLNALVRPYFVGQAYYDAHGYWPAGHDRPHGSEGIIAACKEMIELPEDVDDETVIGFMSLIARPNHPKGTLECPCGSGQLLRHCHGAFIARVRGMVDYRHARRDLDRVQNGWQREQEAAT